MGFQLIDSVKVRRTFPTLLKLDPWEVRLAILPNVKMIDHPSVTGACPRDTAALPALRYNKQEMV